MTLCQSCQKFDIQSFATAPYQTRGYRLLNVERAAEEEDCTFCQFVCRALEGVRQSWRQANLLNDAWVHIRMSKDNDWRGAVRRKRRSGLDFNRLDLFIGPRYVYITADGAELLERLEGGETCRILADHGMPSSHSLRMHLLGNLCLIARSKPCCEKR